MAILTHTAYLLSKASVHPSPVLVIAIFFGEFASPSTLPIMKKVLLFALLASLFGACEPSQEPQEESNNNLELKPYPETRKGEVTDNYHGTEVADPYRWLENDTAAEVEAWVKAQNEVTEHYLSQIPYRNQIKDRLTDIWDYPKTSAPFKEGNYYFSYKNNGLQKPKYIVYPGRAGWYSRGIPRPQSIFKRWNSLFSRYHFF